MIIRKSFVVISQKCTKFQNIFEKHFILSNFKTPNYHSLKMKIISFNYTSTFDPVLIPLFFLISPP